MYNFENLNFDRKCNIVQKGLKNAPIIGINVLFCAIGPNIQMLTESQIYINLGLQQLAEISMDKGNAIVAQKGAVDSILMKSCNKKGFQTFLLLFLQPNLT